MFDRYIKLNLIFLLLGTYKLKKTKLQEEGIDISRVTDTIIFLNKTKFLPLDKSVLEDIESGKIRL